MLFNVQELARRLVLRRSLRRIETNDAAVSNIPFGGPAYLDDLHGLNVQNWVALDRLCGQVGIPLSGAPPMLES